MFSTPGYFVQSYKNFPEKETQKLLKNVTNSKASLCLKLENERKREGWRDGEMADWSVKLCRFSQHVGSDLDKQLAVKLRHIHFPYFPLRACINL